MLEGKMLKVKDIKDYFGCGINRAYDIINTTGFPKITIGKRIYIPEEAFKIWVKGYTYKQIKI